MSKKLFKNIMFIALMAMFFFTLTMTANAETFSGECGAEGNNLTWSLDTETGILKIDGEGEMANYQGYATVEPECSAPWNDYRSSIKELILSSEITSIGSYSFYYCDSLKSLSLPQKIEKINYYAFKGCSSITGDLIIPDSVTYIGEGAFENCCAFSGDLVLSNNVKYISQYAFYECKGFTGDLTIPNSVTSIGNYAFYNCEGFTGDLTIPNSVTSIGERAFQNCIGFNGSLKLSNSILSIESGTFEGCKNLSGELIIPNSITSIGAYAFSGCHGLTGTLVISDNVTTIDNGAFSGCINITGLKLSKELECIPSFAFFNCYSLAGDIIFPESITDIGKSAFWNCNKLDNIIISKEVKSIGYRTFYNTKFKHVAYKGSQADWNNICLNEESETGLENQNIHFNFNPVTDINESITASTCLINGSKTTVCSCGYIYGTEKLALADCSFTTYTSNKNATCTTDGTKTAYCDYSCGKKNTITDEGSALGHAMGEFVITKEATCTVNGEERADCSRCDYYETRELIANNHKDENLDGYCEYCEEYIADKGCICVCHAKTIGAFVYKIFKVIDSIFNTNLVGKVFDISDICVCGIRH